MKQAVLNLIFVMFTNIEPCSNRGIIEAPVEPLGDAYFTAVR
jgi:hypothetical protein